MRRAASVFGETEVEVFDWSGENCPRVRGGAAAKLADRIAGSSVSLLGFSHGGNVAAAATALVPQGRVRALVTIATPVLSKRYRPVAGVNHIHLYSDRDLLQRGGGEALRLPLVGTVGLAERRYPEESGVRNIRVEGISATGMSGRHGDILWWEETWIRLEEALRLPVGNIPE